MELKDYRKRTEIDDAVIYADSEGYFLFEHYPVADGYYAVKIRLGKTAKEIEQCLADDRDWNYRAWHGEMDVILKALEQVRQLPNIQ